MNNQLKNDVYIVPNNIIQKINNALKSIGDQWVDGKQRALNLVNTKKVTYAQLKRIIHDLKNIDKVNDKTRYELYGGDLMDNWSKTFLNNQRSLVKTKKETTKSINNTVGLNGVRKNSYLKKHNKKDSTKIPTNIMKSNSEKTSVSDLNMTNIFEEIKRIKEIIKY
jgi:hypothetical protein